jgi:hypothetical protein
MEHRTESSNNGIRETATYIHNNGGMLRRQRTEQQRGDGRPQRSLEVSATLLHGGLDSSPQVKTSKESLRRLIVGRLSTGQTTASTVSPMNTGAVSISFVYAVSRIRDVYSGSRIRIFFHPGSRIRIKEFKYFNPKFVSRIASTGKKKRAKLPRSF